MHYRMTTKGKKMQTYMFYEQQNQNSHREGSKIKAMSLRGAKRIAKNQQCFERTILKIESESGEVLAICDEFGVWEDIAA
jgi:hypothetical protein